MKIGLLFAGQGAQYSGMGKSLCDYSKKAEKIFDLAGPEIQSWCFEGTKELLKQTQITQPCVYTVSMAAYEAFMEEIGRLDAGNADQIEITGMAGFSLGEYAALTAGNVIPDFETGINIVRHRGSWMNEAGRDENGEAKGGMIAAFGERDHILQCVESAREDGILEGVNFNSPVQTVVAGEKAALERFKAQAKKMGHIKAVPLSVSTAFHSPMMVPAVEKLQALLLQTELHCPTIRIYSNVTGRDMAEGQQGEARDWIAELMAKQAQSPVYWQETIENMIRDGIRILIELGPGNTLCGLAKKTSHQLVTMNIQDQETLQATMETLKGILSGKIALPSENAAIEEGENKC